MKPMNHSGHDVDLLRVRWEELAIRRGWSYKVLTTVSDCPIIVIENQLAAAGESGGFYASAGVHGDECAPIWGLLQWAENVAPGISSRPLTIFPCLNPYGIVENTRRTEDRVDLNREFTNRENPLVKLWQDHLRGRQFDTVVNLHEDYDAAGVYLYELARDEPLGEKILTACEQIIPRETAAEVEGRECIRGILSADAEEIEEVVEDELNGGWPEAIYLFLKHSRNSYTFETPSELDLERRIAAHRRFLETIFG